MSDRLSVRSITEQELELFASLFGSSESAARLAAWVSDRWKEQESRAEWCFLVEKNGVPVGRLLYWSFPTSPAELVLAGLSLDWQGEYRQAGDLLLGESVAQVRADGAESLSASITADPAHFPEKREELFLALGLPVLQQKRKFHLHNERASESGSSRLRFRSMEEATGQQFHEMIARVTEGTLDRSDHDDRLRHGIDGAASRYLELLKEIDADTRLWQLADDSDGRAIGLVIPQRLDEHRGTINYIGVLPEARGNGYVDDLLRRGLDLLHAEGLREVVVDVDALNLPVITALERAGWSNAGSSWKFDLVSKAANTEPTG